MRQKVYITFHNDPSVGLQSEYFTIEIPDPREGWESTQSALTIYIEAIRKRIKELYVDLYFASCSVVFQWEEEALLKSVIPPMSSLQDWELIQEASRILESPVLLYAVGKWGSIDMANGRIKARIENIETKKRMG